MSHSDPNGRFFLFVCLFAAGLFNGNHSGFNSGPSEGLRLAVNNKENKVGIHFLSLGAGGPPTHITPGLLVFRSRDIPTEPGCCASPGGAPVSSADGGPPQLGA